MSTAVDTAAGFRPITPQEEDRPKSAIDSWSDDYALRIAVQDFQKAEAFRTQNVDWKWHISDELYNAWVQQKYWEGTRIPRASLPVYVAFEQIEALLPRILQAIFADNPWFQADPILGTSATQARATGERIAAQLDKTHVREVFRRAIKSAFIYGAGPVELTWLSQEKTSLSYRPQWRTGATGRLQRRLEKRETLEIENRPELNYISVKDFYVDPNCSSPNPRNGQYVCVRQLRPIEWLDNLRGNKEFDIPSQQDLAELARQKFTAQGDNTKATGESMRFGSWMPTIDQTADPAGKRVEIIARVSSDHVVWVANRGVTILNTRNPYGFINYYNAWYTDVLDRFYGISICEITEGEQRFQTSLINSRLDELALSIHKPVLYRRGLNIPSYQLRTRPGQMIQVDDPEKDYVTKPSDNVTAAAYLEQNASEARVQRTTGLNDLISSGVPTSGGNAAARTATGVGAQVEAGSARVQYIVANLEDTFVEPILNDVVTLNNLFPPPGLEAQIAQSRIQITMRASVKMASRQSLLMTFPLLMQTIANPMFMQQLAAQGYTVDWEELFRVFLDTTGYQQRADLVRRLTPQEQQMLNQPPATEVIKERLQDKRLTSNQQITAAKLQHATQLEELKAASRHELERLKGHQGLADSLLATALPLVFHEEKQ